MKDILYVFLVLSLIIGGLILQIDIVEIDTSSWNFTGSNFAVGLTEWLGLIFIAVGFIAILLKGKG